MTLTNGRLLLSPWSVDVEWRVMLQRPGRVRTIRIYEKSPTLRDETALAVLADAFEMANKDSVDEVIRESGIVGQWRPSAIIVKIAMLGTQVLAQSTIAHAMWNYDFNSRGLPGMDLRISFDNDEGRERLVWPHILFEPALVPVSSETWEEDD